MNKLVKCSGEDHTRTISYKLRVLLDESAMDQQSEFRADRSADQALAVRQVEKVNVKDKVAYAAFMKTMYDSVSLCKLWMDIKGYDGC